jgi:hypothetical protein
MKTELAPPLPTDSSTADESKKSEHQTTPPPLSAGTSPDHTSLASQTNNDQDNKSTTGTGRFDTFWRILDKITYTPKRCRWDPDEPPRFNIWLNLLFGAAGAFTVANLYYSHPILDILAEDFGVNYVEVANIPTLAQAGYAVGLFSLCPLGDLLKRRPFVLYLVFFTASLS